jgi:hypothetical protein
MENIFFEEEYTAEELKEELDRVYDEIEREEREIREFNEKFLSDLNYDLFLKDLKTLILDDIAGEIVVVDKPKGKWQLEEGIVINEAWVDQHCSNEEGDSFYGTFTVRYPYSNKYIEIPFNC